MSIRSGFHIRPHNSRKTSICCHLMGPRVTETKRMLRRLSTVNLKSWSLHRWGRWSWMLRLQEQHRGGGTYCNNKVGCKDDGRSLSVGMTIYTSATLSLSGIAPPKDTSLNWDLDDLSKCSFYSTPDRCTKATFGAKIKVLVQRARADNECVIRSAFLAGLLSIFLEGMSEGKDLEGKCPNSERENCVLSYEENELDGSVI
ncbi:hypothetical protein K504DRAFT_216134 [Pleomassaria siparia CBS 279.74]|uniref:Uncharacterized protein n=1 Tax=Pleomassaria siparia CBS 279.74 TaxID=1314801 RepID=A0A6G1KEF7_9PLEO|nr:hypothetical protein K504DRAFT_216134 [Pleomassaria siparia CBS 279.74]